MPVTVNINSAQIAVDIRAASEKARGITSQQALADCNEYVPDDQDALVNSSNIHSDILHGKLVWSTPYARYLYHGVLMVDPKPVQHGRGRVRRRSRSRRRCGLNSISARTRKPAPTGASAPRQTTARNGGKSTKQHCERS